MANKSRISIKRAYDAATDKDGLRVYIDRLWPRGIKKESAHFDEWIKTLAPSTELRKWFKHDPDKFDEFRKRYMKELDEQGEAIGELLAMCRKQGVTLVFSAKDTAHNNAVVLKEYLEKQLGS